MKRQGYQAITDNANLGVNGIRNETIEASSSQQLLELLLLSVVEHLVAGALSHHESGTGSDDGTSRNLGQVHQMEGFHLNGRNVVLGTQEVNQSLTSVIESWVNTTLTAVVRVARSSCSHEDRACLWEVLNNAVS
jgi:hypothetical protein